MDGRGSTGAPDPIVVEALAHAVEIVGGQIELATILRVTHDDLQKWLRGAASPPSAVVFSALNIAERVGVQPAPQPGTWLAVKP